MYYFRWHIHSSIRTCGRFGEHEETLYSCVHLCGFSIIWRCLFKHWRQCDSSLIGCWRFLCFKTSPNYNIQRCTNPLWELLPWRRESRSGVAISSWDELSRHGHQMQPSARATGGSEREYNMEEKEREPYECKTKQLKYNVYSHRSWINFIPNTLNLQKFWFATDRASLHPIMS